MCVVYGVEACVDSRQIGDRFTQLLSYPVMRLRIWLSGSELLGCRNVAMC